MGGSGGGRGREIYREGRKLETREYKKEVTGSTEHTSGVIPPPDAGQIALGERVVTQARQDVDRSPGGYLSHP